MVFGARKKDFRNFKKGVDRQKDSRYTFKASSEP
jgi:hypothetical protein